MFFVNLFSISQFIRTLYIHTMHEKFFTTISTSLFKCQPWFCLAGEKKASHTSAELHEIQGSWIYEAERKSKWLTCSEFNWFHLHGKDFRDGDISSYFLFIESAEHKLERKRGVTARVTQKPWGNETVREKIVGETERNMKTKIKKEAEKKRKQPPSKITRNFIEIRNFFNKMRGINHNILANFRWIW